MAQPQLAMGARMIPVRDKLPVEETTDDGGSATIYLADCQRGKKRTQVEALFSVVATQATLRKLGRFRFTPPPFLGYFSWESKFRTNTCFTLRFKERTDLLRPEAHLDGFMLNGTEDE